MKKKLTIGIDFDNTIIIYDDLFHKCALEMGYIDKGFPKIKKNIRDKIRSLSNGEEKWIVLQSIVYGTRILEAGIADGFLDFFYGMKANGADIYIISHKTQFPAMGEKVDLRNAARGWMEDRDFFSDYGLGVNICNDVFFESTRREKLDRIGSQNCDIFIDDLEEVLLDSSFPKGVHKIHYSKVTSNNSDMITCSHWHDIADFVKNF